MCGKDWEKDRILQKSNLQLVPLLLVENRYQMYTAG